MTLRRLLAAALVLFAAAASAATTEVTLRRRVLTTIEGKSQTEDRPVRVLLAPSALVIDDGWLRVIRDFNTRRRYAIDLVKKTTTEGSLYAEVAGRDAEMQNREGLDEMMRAGGAKMPFTMAENENEMSIRASKSTTKITRSEEKGTIRFRSEKELLAEVSTDVIPADEATRKAFVRYIRYDAGGHPDILSAIAAMSGIPRIVRIIRSGTGGESRLTVSSARTIPDETWTIGATRLALQDHPNAGAIATRAWTATPEQIAAAKKKIVDDAVAMGARGETLESFLAFLEYTFVAGTTLPPEFQEQKAAFLADANVRLVTTSLRPNSKDEAEASIKNLESVKTLAKQKAYVVDILIGNMKAHLGDGDGEADELFQAIRAQPLLAGVWHDLGQNAYKHFDTIRAWDSWDIARHIGPHHGQMKDVVEFEQRLVVEYPEYF